MGILYPFLELYEEYDMKRAGKKLRSDRGASLMMALLLFLVCAVIGTAVLTAGTAASGRMSNIAVMDQRYYSVNSAVNLLIDLFRDQVITIRKEAPDDGEASYQIKCNDGEYVDYPEGSVSTLPEEMAVQIIRRDSSAPGTEPEFKVQLSSETQLGSLPEISGVLYSDDRLVFTVSSDPTKAEKYQLDITLAPQKQEKKSLKIEEDRTITVTETSYSWKLSDVK